MILAVVAATWLLAGLAAGLAFGRASRLFAPPAPRPDPPWERRTMPLFEATNRRLSCRIDIEGHGAAAGGTEA